MPRSKLRMRYHPPDCRNPLPFKIQIFVPATKKMAAPQQVFFPQLLIALHNLSVKFFGLRKKSDMDTRTAIQR